jgi:hypothetical protein
MRSVPVLRVPGLQLPAGRVMPSLRSIASCGLLLCAIGAGNASFASTGAATVPAAPDAAPVKQLQKVVVSGVQAGPGLWKVSNGAHTLWILGLVSPVPRKMDWYSPQAEARLAEAQELITPPLVSATVGMGSVFKLAFAMPALLRARKNPDDKTLRDVLPPDLYARWQGLKLQYMPENKDVEEWRPSFAAGALYDAALKAAGLEQGNRIRARIDDLADKRKLRKTSAAINLKIESPRGLAKSLSGSNVDELACFRSVLDQLDADVADAADRANAWAVGDVDELTRLVRKSDDSCLEAFTQIEAVRDLGIKEALPRADAKWMAAADAALAANSTTFAMLPMTSLLSDDGLLARLRAKGYVIEAPE